RDEQERRRVEPEGRHGQSSDRRRRQRTEAMTSRAHMPIGLTSGRGDTGEYPSSGIRSTRWYSSSRTWAGVRSVRQLSVSPRRKKPAGSAARFHGADTGIDSFLRLSMRHAAAACSGKSGAHGTPSQEKISPTPAAVSPISVSYRTSR